MFNEYIFSQDCQILKPNLTIEQSFSDCYAHLSPAWHPALHILRSLLLAVSKKKAKNKKKKKSSTYKAEGQLNPMNVQSDAVKIFFSWLSSCRRKKLLSKILNNPSACKINNHMFYNNLS